MCAAAHKPLYAAVKVIYRCNMKGNPKKDTELIISYNTKQELVIM